MSALHSSKTDIVDDDTMTDNFNSVVAAFHYAIVERRKRFGSADTRRRLDDLAAFVEATANNMKRACASNSGSAESAVERQDECLTVASEILQSAMKRLDAGDKKPIDYALYETLYAVKDGRRYKATRFEYFPDKRALIGGLLPGRRQSKQPNDDLLAQKSDTVAKKKRKAVPAGEKPKGKKAKGALVSSTTTSVVSDQRPADISFYEKKIDWLFFGGPPESEEQHKEQQKKQESEEQYKEQKKKQESEEQRKEQQKKQKSDETLFSSDQESKDEREEEAEEESEEEESGESSMSEEFDDIGMKVRPSARQHFENQFRLQSQQQEKQQRPTPALEFPTKEELQLQASALMRAELKKNRLRSNRLSLWWQRREPNFRDFAAIDNEGGGDCFYYALAPMLRILKPSMFPGSPNDALAPMRDMMRLRSILSLNVPPVDSSDYRGLLDSYDHDLLQQGMRAQYAYKYAQDRRALQLHLMKSDHWASLGDLELAQRAFGGNVGFIVINRLHQARKAGSQPSITCVAPESLVSGKQAGAGIRYLLILYDGQHYMRLRHKDGQFAFTQAELQRYLPNLWAEYSLHCFAGALSRTLVQAVNDFLALPQNAALKSAVERKEYSEIAENLWRLSADDADRVYEQYPQLRNYSALSAEQKSALFDRLAPPQRVEEFLLRRQKKAAN